MVTVRRQQTDEVEARDWRAWLEQLTARVPVRDREILERACARAEQCERAGEAAGGHWPYGKGCLAIGLEMADVLADLGADAEALPRRCSTGRSVRASCRCWKWRRSSAPPGHPDRGRAAHGGDQHHLNPTRKAVLGQQDGQLDNIRKMLLAMVDDVRVALVKLAERTVIIRAVKESDPERQQKVAREVFDIYAPLAHRLGVGQLKWELEDLSFRYLQPGAYKKVAKLLDEKRLDREHYIDEVISSLRGHLERNGIRGAQVYGRAKHIYSIWRKMQKKHLDFGEVYDVRAVRVLVREMRDCYAALGIVHSLWKHVPKEFDDYIASPKENGYQSLHTAVVGPERKMLEVQIRTFDMHEEAELGVCAHWRYKEGSKAGRKSRSYEQRIAWLRQVLEWHDELGDNADTMIDELKHGLVSDRVYVFTPDGHVVDLEAGATPVDFAYHIHTEVGHRCRGAKVNGHIVPLNYNLNTGEQVEILTAKEGGPSRDWMTPSLGYVATSSARARIQQWFKRQDRDVHIAQGRAILERETSRLALDRIDLDALAPQMNLKTGDDLLAALGAGDLRPGHVVNQAQSLLGDDPQQELAFVPARSKASESGDVTIQGWATCSPTWPPAAGRCPATR